MGQHSVDNVGVNFGVEIQGKNIKLGVEGNYRHATNNSKHEYDLTGSVFVDPLTGKFTYGGNASFLDRNWKTKLEYGKNGSSLGVTYTDNPYGADKTSITAVNQGFNFNPRIGLATSFSDILPGVADTAKQPDTPQSKLFDDSSSLKNAFSWTDSPVTPHYTASKTGHTKKTTSTHSEHVSKPTLNPEHEVTVKATVPNVATLPTMFENLLNPNASEGTVNQEIKTSLETPSSQNTGSFIDHLNLSEASPDALTDHPIFQNPVEPSNNLPWQTP